MSEDSIIKCLIAFILGWLLCRMMGNGFRVGGGALSDFDKWLNKPRRPHSRGDDTDDDIIV